MPLFKQNNIEKLSHVCAVVPAAGNSSRMGGENKLLLELDGIPVLIRTLTVLSNCTLIDEIIISCREQDILPYSKLISAYGIEKVTNIVCGGATRAHSVLCGIRACPEKATLVAVHDAARPLIPQDVLTQTIFAAEEHGAAAPVVEIKDSIKKVIDGKIIKNIDRATTFAVQTPQVFDREILKQALEKAIEQDVEITDDCSAVEAFDVEVFATEGSYENIKITTPEDIAIGEIFLQRVKEYLK